jgi:nucleoside diphosphate kinase
VIVQATRLQRPLVEPVIAMLKPDAWERGLAEAVLERLRAHGFVEERRCEHHLRPEQVQALFLHPLADYVAHLTSRPVSFHLLRGPGGPEQLYDSKCAIRREFGVPHRTRNLIHGTDEGTEYHRFLSHFPEACVLQHCGVADLDLRFPASTSLAQARAELARLDAESDLVRVSVTLTPDQQALAALRHCAWRRLDVRFAVLASVPGSAPECTVLIHAHQDEDLALLMGRSGAPSAWAGRPITLADFPITPQALARYEQDLRTPGIDIDAAVAGYPLMQSLMLLKERGVTRMNVYSPRMSLMETELRGDLARVLGLHSSGGSCGQAAAGSFSVSQHSLGGLDPLLPRDA